MQPVNPNSDLTPGEPRSLIRVMVVDDHALLREGVTSVLDRLPDMVMVASVGDGKVALEQFRTLTPDVTLMDMRMPTMDGMSSIAGILAYAPQAKVIALSTYAGDALVKSARKAGARGYLLKSMLADNMPDVIRAVHSGQQCWPPELQRTALDYGDDLSPRECEVVRHVARGASNREIGASLGLSEETVKSYMRVILPKLRANDRAHAVAISIQRGFLNSWDLS
jgi:DNA-binding NarL/FixJ family response regulator